jgi:hypothetical protein
VSPAIRSTWGGGQANITPVDRVMAGLRQEQEFSGTAKILNENLPTSTYNPKHISVHRANGRSNECSHGILHYLVRAGFNIRIIRGTGYEILDINLIETIKEVAPFPKPPISAGA